MILEVIGVIGLFVVTYNAIQSFLLERQVKKMLTTWSNEGWESSRHTPNNLSELEEINKEIVERNKSINNLAVQEQLVGVLKQFSEQSTKAIQKKKEE